MKRQLAVPLVLALLVGCQEITEPLPQGLLTSAAQSLPGATFIVTTVADAGPGSLRQAIADANLNPGTDAIHFAIGTGPQTIVLLSGLEAITDPVILDATTQPGFAGSPLIVLDGSVAGLANGLHVQAGASTIRGLVITGFESAGIALYGGGNRIEGNHVLGNRGFGGVQVFSPNNTIGGLGASARNVISGNRYDGVSLGSSGNVVLGNYIGTDPTGTTALPNGWNGVFVIAPRNTIGGTAAGAGNVISGNAMVGVRIEEYPSRPPNEAVVQGNFIGTDAAGRDPLGNQWGVSIIGSDNLIGGTDPGAGNVISGNESIGVQIHGLHPTLPATGNMLLGNAIGTDVTGLQPLGNGDIGVRLTPTASNNAVGGTSPGAGNTIAFNGASSTGAGVVLIGNGSGNAILANSIHSNSGLGIDLQGLHGVSLNDAGDRDTGPNGLQNFPVLASVGSAGPATIIRGSLDSAAGETFLVEIFSSESADPSGHGEGRMLIDRASVTTDAVGSVTFELTPETHVAEGAFISATATDAAGSTSEFSAAVAVTPLPPAEVTEVLEDAVQDLLDAGAFDEPDQANSLFQKLENFLSSIENDRPSAIGLLTGFIAEVEGMVSAGILTAEEAWYLIEVARSALAELD